MQGLLLLDPTEHEEHRAEAELVVSYMASLNQVRALAGGTVGRWLFGGDAVHAAVSQGSNSQVSVADVCQEWLVKRALFSYF